jgi:hypothetical protein
MKRHLTFKETALNTLMSQREFEQIMVCLKDVCDKDDDILGVLLTGSFIQNRRLLRSVPDLEMTPQTKHYYSMHLMKNKKIGIHPASDIDFWVLTKDINNCLDEEIDKRIIELYHNFLTTG